MANWKKILLEKIPIIKKAKGEDAICLDFCGKLQRLTRQDKFHCVWFHVVNEFAGGSKPLFGAKLKAMGKVAGAPDYIFMHQDGSFFIEFKTKTGKQLANQIAFEYWCLEKGVKYYIARSSDEAFEILKKEGVL